MSKVRIYTETILNTVYIMMHVKDVHIFEFDNLVLVFARGTRASIFPAVPGNTL